MTNQKNESPKALLAAVIHLDLKTDRQWLGRAAQAWLLESVRQVESTLADRLHVEHAQRPYTISVPRRIPGSSTSDSGYYMRITSSSADLSAVLTESILPGLKVGETIRLADADAIITEAMTENHPWAGQADFETLAHSAFAPDAAPPLRHTLEFATPTVFHRAGLAIPLPIPKLVFGSLIRAWNTFSPVPLPVQMLDVVENLWVLHDTGFRREWCNLEDRSSMLASLGLSTTSSGPSKRQDSRHKSIASVRR
jgi:CRISPR-associated endoribonuclease Cas6